MQELTHAYLREIFDLVDGKFIRIKKTSRNIQIGTIAGCKRKDGYLVIRILDKLYLAHRLAWFWHHGEWPNKLIDHVDGNKENNNISNLREANQSTNGFNRGKKKTNRTGYKGVVFYKPYNKYMARITKNRKSIFLGYFDTAEKAHEAYCDAAVIYHKEFANTK